MSTQAIAVTPVQGFIPASETEIQIVQDSHEKLGAILEKLLSDFKADVLKLAGTVTSASVENFPFDNFVNNWTQLLERFRNRSGAIASFRLELSNVRDVFKKEHAQELIAAFEVKLAVLQKELAARNQVDEVIEQEIADTREIIAELESLGSTYKTGQAAQAARKRAPVQKVTAVPAVQQSSSRKTKQPSKATKKRSKKRTTKKAVKK